MCGECILPSAQFVPVETCPVDFDRNHDARVRGAAFDWLARQVSIHGDVLPRTTLAQGFEYDRRRVPVTGPQGIFKPALMQVPLSITTSPKGPYDDAIGSDNLLRYRYRGTDPSHLTPPTSSRMQSRMVNLLSATELHYVDCTMRPLTDFSWRCDRTTSSRCAPTFSRKSMARHSSTQFRGSTASLSYCRESWWSNPPLSFYPSGTNDFLRWRRHGEKYN